VYNPPLRHLSAPTGDSLATRWRIARLPFASGEIVLVTDRGRVVAELRLPGSASTTDLRYQELVAAGAVRPAVDPDDRSWTSWRGLGLPAAATLYAETSAILRVLLEGDRQLARALTDAPRLVTSDLTLAESDRGLRRALVAGRLDPKRFRDGAQWLTRFARACDILALDRHILDRARRDFPVEPVRTLDALHLATLEMWHETIGPVAVLSTDTRVRANAAAWGLHLIPS
jgi:PIN domain